MNLSSWIDFPLIRDYRGSLVALEAENTIPFKINRVYYIYNVSLEEKRGFHAHRILNQVAVCVSGSCKITLDNGDKREDFLLDSPVKGLLIKEMIWREMSEFSQNCVLMIFASEHYTEDDYIRDYDDFLNHTKR